MSTMPMRRRPFSPWRHGLETVLALVFMNAFLITVGRPWSAVYLDVVAVAITAVVTVATRLWPDKIHFRRAGE